ncbi:quinone-dependent dihydroorotate dehydrogenase [Fodinicurvata fenggangensis]|uniref:quinone-dependent dihydroorotate dehydrogenase n=1 Tax=Fodinicurvata fenggangensis TaxID=1121830 RepID=UPI0004791EAC|nr:quinone-dependent dihydroorotate dehydrogenase [Fodinicurvata fenggangensis]
MRSDLFPLVRPLLHALDPERAHRLTLQALKAGLGPKPGQRDESRLQVRLWGKTFASPLGLAAGFDKDAEAVEPLLSLGFGFVEVGSLTPRPQTGNPRPRLFRLSEDQAVINRMGFNNGGIESAAERIRHWRESDGQGLLGINLGKNKDSPDAAADYARGAALLAPLADYLVINVSSPNTPGLRALQGRGELERLIAAVQDVLPQPAPPLVLKIAPDLTPEDRADIAAVALAAPLQGLIVSNTTIARPDSLKSRHRSETGGLSGRPLMGPSTELLAEMHRLTEGRMPLIGTGGIASGEDAYHKIRAGACLVQLYTTLVYQGPALIKSINQGLIDCLERDGFNQLSQAVGIDAA